MRTESKETDIVWEVGKAPPSKRDVQLKSDGSADYLVGPGGGWGPASEGAGLGKGPPVGSPWVVRDWSSGPEIIQPVRQVHLSQTESVCCAVLC